MPSVKELLENFKDAKLTFPHGNKFKKIIDDLERHMVLGALKQHNGNMAAAARHLKITRTAFVHKLKKIKRLSNK